MYSLIRHGGSSIQLQKWRQLRVSVKLVENVSSFATSYSSASAANVSSRDGQKAKNFTVSYLVDSLGLSTKLAESISRKFLQSRGASSSELTEIVSTVPKILAKKKGKSISKYYDLVKDIIEADKISKFGNPCLSLPQGRQGNKLRNVSALIELGMPQRLLFSLLSFDYGPVHGKEKFEESLKKVVEMGFNPTSQKFAEALRIVYGLREKTIQDKVNVYKNLGFSVEDVWAMFKKFPMFLGLSEKTIANSIDTFIGLGFTRDEFVMMAKRFPPCLGLSAEPVKKKTEFLVKEMNWPLKTVSSYPPVLGLSLEKRIVPRCNVVKVLMSKGLLGSELPPISLLGRTDKVFLQRYVRKHDDKQLVTELMAKLSGDHAS